MHCVEVYQINLTLVKHEKTFSLIDALHNIARKIKVIVLHIDCKSVCLAEPALHTDRRIRFQHFVQLVHYL